ncbi:MAG: hypothetical protein JWQ62_777 [Lacunisphaera sp.]|nr:hypothetical protein [Lacunisphaera sp.]
MNNTPAGQIVVSIGLLARNEETGLPGALATLFRQSIFAELERRGLRAEIWLVANACTDDTAAVAERIFHEQGTTHPQRASFFAHAVSVATPGKINAWNLFVHEISTHEARSLILMDADILLGPETTLWNLYQGLEDNAVAQVTVGEVFKDLATKSTPSLRERISLSTSRLTQSSTAQLTGQLYCIRAETARRIRLPRDLAACEDGFIKNLVCTDFLLKESNPDRILKVAGAAHTFEAYTTASAILRNQKRQMIGQTFVHVLVDTYLPARCARNGLSPAETVEQLDEEDPQWLRNLIRNHVRDAGHFWLLFPGVCTFRLKRWASQRGWQKARHLPATLVGCGVTMVAAWLAFSSLRQGLLEYWPVKPSRADGLPPDPLAGGFGHPRAAAF